MVSRPREIEKRSSITGLVALEWAGRFQDSRASPSGKSSAENRRVAGYFVGITRFSAFTAIQWAESLRKNHFSRMTTACAVAN
jgi:hypothetical protein